MILTTNFSSFLVDEDCPIDAALMRISENKQRVVFVVGSDGVLLGSLTDGDFRRWLTSQPTPSLQTSVSQICNTSPRWVAHGTPLNEIAARRISDIDLIPLLDKRNRIIALAIPRDETLVIGKREISSNHPSYIIAEIGINHNGSLDTALKLVDTAAATGADCIKFQLRDMNSLYRDSSLGNEDLGAQYTLDLIRETQLSRDDLAKAMNRVKEHGLTPLCTAWDIPSADFLHDYGVPAFKIASADLTNHELISHLASLDRPLIQSTGMSTEVEIRQTVKLLETHGSAFALLQCNSAYPSPFKDVHLRHMDRLREIGNCVVGYSGHERGHHVAVAAVAMGACIIEKHITLDKNGRGNDHVVSLEPQEFSQMVREIRDVEAAMGSNNPRAVNQGEALNRLSLSKSLIAARDLAVGEILSRQDIEVRSPGRGLQPNRLGDLVGASLTRQVKHGDFFYDSDISGVKSQARKFSFERSWGIPVRFHDWKDLSAKSNPDLLEFHLSYRDMEIDPDDIFSEELSHQLYVHSPDLFPNDHILDLASTHQKSWEQSITELQRVIDLTRTMRKWFPESVDPVIIVSMGGSSKDGPLPFDMRPELYERVFRAYERLDREGVEVIVQTLPPYPWYLGGQRYCNLFVDPTETVDFSRKYGIPLCFDTAHTKLATNHLRLSFSQATEELLPQTRHLHLVDASGVDVEGLQIGEGEIDWPVLMASLISQRNKPSFIPEIWQGHVDGGAAFWEALNTLETMMNDDDGHSAFS